MSATSPRPRPIKPGTVRAAWSYPKFRAVFIGFAMSRIGTWMQNFTLPAYIDVRTGSATMVGFVVFAALGPLLFLSIPAGMLADRVDRTRLVVAGQVVMLGLSIVLAALVAVDASVWAILGCQLGIGIANTVQGPAFSSSFPMMVDRIDLPGAISLNSAMTNGSRIAGPSLAALLSAIGLSMAQLFLVNSLTYLFLIVPLLFIALPMPILDEHRRRGWQALGNGVRIAARRGVLRNSLLTMFMFSLFCLPFVGLFPSIARTNFGLDPAGGGYKALYVTWGLGAFLGAVSVGTLFASADRLRLVRRSLIAFAVSIALFAVFTSLPIVFPVAAALGAAYFMTATSLATILQENLADVERASVMPLWMMSFGGTVPFGNMLGGPVIDHIGVRPLLLFGAVAAVVIMWRLDMTRLPKSEFLHEPAPASTSTSASG